MKYNNICRVFQAPYYVNFKKHYCPKCKELLGKVTESRVLHEGSDMLMELKEYMPSRNRPIGTVKYIWTEFRCPKCGRQFTVNTMKRVEGVYGK